jgi:hypothetical protein
MRGWLVRVVQRRALRWLFATVALFVLLVGFAAGRPLPSQAASISYCGQADGRFTPAHGWCYAGWPGYWRHASAAYNGSGSFGICAAMNDFYSRVTLVKRCSTPPYFGVGVNYCGSNRNADPGVGNQDNNRHTITGYAQSPPHVADC